MPRKKNSECSEHVKLMQVLKTRLIKISLKMENYIYKEKPITELQAKAFLDEILSYKSHCQNDIGYLQVCKRTDVHLVFSDTFAHRHQSATYEESRVIEKLTKYMNIIISENRTKSPVKDVNSNKETLTNTKENLSLPVDIASETINENSKNKTQTPTDKQNHVGLALHESTSVNKTDKKLEESIENCHKKVKEISQVNKSVDFEKDNVTNISSKVIRNDVYIKSNNETSVSHTTARFERLDLDNGRHENKIATNNDQITQNKADNSTNDCLLICVDSGVIHKINHLANATVVHHRPQLNIPSNAFALNNSKKPNIFPHSNVIKNDAIVKCDDPKNVSVNNKTDGAKLNNKKVKFPAFGNDVTKIEQSSKNKSDEKNNELGKIMGNILPKKRSTKKSGTKNNNPKKIKEPSAMKSKRPAIKKKLNKRKTNVTHVFPSEVKLQSSNDLEKTAVSDLSWFESIKYVRKIDEQEYFKPLQPLDDNFWYNPTLPLCNDREFNM